MSSRRLPRVLRRRSRDRGGARVRRGRRATAARSSSVPGRWPRASRWSWSRAAPPRAGSGPRPATPVRSRPTTGSSTACAARPAITRAATHRGGVRGGRHVRHPAAAARARVVVLTTAGGWGVVTADALAATDLELLPLPDDLPTAIDALLPPRWSRNNPVDLAGGETRDTIPEVLDLVVGHPDVDAVIYLGLGIQSNQARLDARAAASIPGTASSASSSTTSARTPATPAAAAAVSERHGKPVLVRDRAGRHRARQPRPRRRAGERTALLPVGQPSCHGTAPSLARRPLPAGEERLTHMRARQMILPGALALAAVACVTVALRLDAAAATDGTALAERSLVTPILSARRVPGWVAAPVAQRRLQAELEAWSAYSPAQSCLVVHDAKGRQLFAHQPTLPVVPASTEKLITADGGTARPRRRPPVRDAGRHRRRRPDRCWRATSPWSVAATRGSHHQTRSPPRARTHRWLPTWTRWPPRWWRAACGASREQLSVTSRATTSSAMSPVGLSATWIRWRSARCRHSR